MPLAFHPKFRLTSEIQHYLQQIEAARHKVSKVALSPKAKKAAWQHSLRYFEMLEEISPSKKELQRYIAAYSFISSWTVCDEPKIKQLHALILGHTRPSRYRPGQNGVLDPITHEVLYYPPKAKDVAPLMKSLLTWIQTARYPCPIIAAIAHLGINSIHPFYDGNGRSARLLTRWILQNGSYDLQGLLCLEDHYAKNLNAYYAALTIKNSTNYYDGPASRDVTSWLAYFCQGMALSCHNALKFL